MSELLNKNFGFVWSILNQHWIPDPAKRPNSHESILSKYVESKELESIEIPETDDIVCEDHPTYRGLRLGSRVKQCPKCIEIYNRIKTSGFKEQRNGV